MKPSASRILVPLSFALAMFGAGAFAGRNFLGNTGSLVGGASLQQEMDTYCRSELKDRYNSNASPDEKARSSVESFFSRRLHTCVKVEVYSDPKDAGAMNYLVSDLTYGFVAPPKWHQNEMPLHVIRTDYGSYHHLYAEGYWSPVSSDPGQQSVAESNIVKLSCEYADGSGAAGGSDICTETEGYTQFGSLQTDTQTYHIASWSPDEVIASDAERGLSGATTTTLLIRPEANEVEVVDRTRMDGKQTSLFKGMEGRSFGDHYELHGGMYLLDTEGVFFQCDEDGVVTDMRFDVVEKHHGDVVEVPNAEWNAGSKANHKFTRQECSSAMQKELGKLR